MNHASSTVSEPATTILVIEDDPVYQKLLRHICQKHRYRVLVAPNATEALESYARQYPDLVLLDIMLPDKSGWEVCKLLLSQAFVPIIFLTTLDSAESVVRGLDAGAVDYVTKPFSSSELVARVESALRWYRPTKESSARTYYDDGYLMIDLDAQQVCVQGKPAQLTATEYQLLSYLFQNAGHVCTHLGLLRSVWGTSYRSPVHYIYNYIRYLRQRIEPDPSDPQYLISVRGRGYLFRPRS